MATETERQQGLVLHVAALEGEVQDAAVWQADPATGSTDTLLAVVDPEGWWSAQVRFDGCIHLYRYFNVPLTHRGEGGDDDDDTVNYLHICDVDELIDRLTALKVEAQRHFGEGWPD